MTRVAEDRLALGSGLPTTAADPTPSSYGITVRQALAMPALADAEVLAGADGLDRHVLRLGVWETPDVLPFTRHDELLVTTGYPLQERPDALAAQLEALAGRGVVAVAIKLGPYLAAVPGDALAAADRVGLPVLALGKDVSLDDVLNQVLSAVLGRQAAMLERSEEIHRALVQVVLGGGGLPEVARAISDGLGLSVLVTDTGGRVAAQVGPDVPPEQVVDRVVVPIVAGGVGHGSVTAVSASGPIAAPDVHALERAAVVCALVAVKQQAVSAVEERYQADFLRDLLLGRVEDVGAVVRHASTLGWELDRSVVVVTAQPDGPAGAGPVGELLTERVASAWRAVLRSRDRGSAICAFASEVVAVVGVPTGSDVERLVRDLAAAAREPATSSRPTLTVGASRIAEGVPGIAAAYEQSRICVRVSRQVHGPGAVAHFDRLGVHRLLSLVPDSAELRAFLDETLGELAEPNPGARDLRRTLEVLLDTNLNVAETARRLHFHYNTLRYRIGNLERILGPFTEDADLRLDLALALRIMPMRGLG
jgi:purine catabolism regulator